MTLKATFQVLSIIWLINEWPGVRVVVAISKGKVRRFSLNDLMKYTIPMQINIGAIRSEINKMPVGISIVKPESPFSLIYTINREES